MAPTFVWSEGPEAKRNQYQLPGLPTVDRSSTIWMLRCLNVAIKSPWFDSRRAGGRRRAWCYIGSARILYLFLMVVRFIRKSSRGLQRIWLAFSSFPFLCKDVFLRQLSFLVGGSEIYRKWYKYHQNCSINPCRLRYRVILSLIISKPLSCKD